MNFLLKASKPSAVSGKTAIVTSKLSAAGTNGVNSQLPPLGSFSPTLLLGSTGKPRIAVAASGVIPTKSHTGSVIGAPLAAGDACAVVVVSPSPATGASADPQADASSMNELQTQRNAFVIGGTYSTVPG